MQPQFRIKFVIHAAKPGETVLSIHALLAGIRLQPEPSDQDEFCLANRHGNLEKAFNFHGCRYKSLLELFNRTASMSSNPQIN